MRTFSKPGNLPIRYSYKQHKINPALIDSRPVKLIKKLRKHGHQGYIVGGALRDLLLGLSPKDFDVVTDASPSKVKQVFPHAIIIGRRFKLVHIVIRDQMIEVSTFRANKLKFSQRLRGLLSLKRDQYFQQNLYGSMEEDVLRRDITANALYYDPINATLIDYVNGYNDILAKEARIIGDPYKRLMEDPMRILRIIRFSAKLGMKIPDDVMNAIEATKPHIAELPKARLFDEFVKLFMVGHAQQSYKLLRKNGLLGFFFPYNWERHQTADEIRIAALDRALLNTDLRQRQEQHISITFLLSLFLWPRYESEMAKYKIPAKKIQVYNQHHNLACSIIFKEQREYLAIPTRIFWRLDRIWQLQNLMLAELGNEKVNFVKNKQFKLAYDLLCVRKEWQPKLQEACVFWQKSVEANTAYLLQQQEKLKKSGAKDRKGRKRQSGRNRRKYN